MIISIAAEGIATFFSFKITNAMLATLIVDGFLLMTALKIKASGLAWLPGGFQNLVEFIIEIFYDFAKSIGGDKTNLFFSSIFTFFIFILFSNWVALLPGFSAIFISEHGVRIPLLRSPSADLNNTLALGLVSVLLVQYFGFKFHGFAYFKKFVNLRSPVDFFVGVLELILELAKIVSFGFRLFGNIFAGEVLLLIAGFLLPFLSPIPVLGLELFVGFIQALVFTTLTLVFLSMAVSEAVH